MKENNTKYVKNNACCEVYILALQNIASYKHADTTCSLEAQGYDPLECAVIAAQDALAQIAQDALSATEMK